jgi:hypothetical protein
MTVEPLRAHRAKQGKEQLSIGPGYDDNDLVCPGPRGSPWRPDVFSASFAKAIRRLNIRQMRFHDLRHSHAAHLLRAGVHPKVVSERLGHSRVGITLDTYSHVLPACRRTLFNELMRCCPKRELQRRPCKCAFQHLDHRKNKAGKSGLQPVCRLAQQANTPLRSDLKQRLPAA